MVSFFFKLSLYYFFSYCMHLVWYIWKITLKFNNQCCTTNVSLHFSCITLSKSKNFLKDLITGSKAVALGYLSSPFSMKPRVKNSHWVLFIYDCESLLGYFRRRNSRLDIHWFKRAHEGGLIYEYTHMLSFELGWSTSAGKCYVSMG